jgi:hypothetical protein
MTTPKTKPKPKKAAAKPKPAPKKPPDVPSQSCGICRYHVNVTSECVALPGLRRVVPPTKTCPLWQVRT